MIAGGQMMDDGWGDEPQFLFKITQIGICATPCVNLGQKSCHLCLLYVTYVLFALLNAAHDYHAEIIPFPA